jgi:hypothetical protein
MSRYIYLLFVYLLLFSHSLLANRQGMTCLLNAYPDFLSQSTDTSSNTLIWKDGTKMLYDLKIEVTDFEDLLNKADLKTQMSIPYPLGALVEPPALNQDPGRLRYEPFFEKMYGNSGNEVKKQLTKVFWAPSNSYVTFSRTNGASESLVAVGKEIMQQPDLLSYVSKSLGTFNWRTIQGTSRKSNHSFGIAIDFELPKQSYKYWLWYCKPNQSCQYPKSVLTDTILQRVVSLFEKHGFIWGGKWYHYDTMHFEYRPELVNCSTSN